MMKLIAFFCLIPALAQAADNPSLFFTPDEARAIGALAAKASTADSDADCVHLGAVFYYAPDDWVLWLQQKKWVPATRDPALAVVEVTPDVVRLRITPLSGAAPYEIRLRPYQSYQLSTGRVLEGVRSASVSPSPSEVSSESSPDDAR